MKKKVSLQMMMLFRKVENFSLNTNLNLLLNIYGRERIYEGKERVKFVIDH